MNLFFQRALATMLLLCAALAPGPAFATIGSVAATPSALRVNVIAPQTLSVTWRVLVSIGAPVTVVSTEGRIFVDGVPVATVSGSISRAVTTLGTSTVLIRDTLRISRALARRIGAGGTIDYRREFEEVPMGSPGVTGVVAIRPTGSGPIAIQNIELRFSDDSQYEIVSRHEHLIARAEITTTGSGVFEGVWEHAGPGGLSTGRAIFQPLRRERRPLAGSRRVVFQSPPLPTAIPGIHILRFRPLRIDLRPVNERVAAVELRYAVRPGEGEPAITLLSPPDAALLTPATRFAWHPEPGAALHRLEFLAPGAGPVDDRALRLAAVDLPGTNASTHLKSFTLERIARGSAPVFWRVLAFDATGRKIAVSPLRQLARFPSQNWNLR